MILFTLILHIIAGAVALLVGYSVIFIKKGGVAHKYLGRTYVVAMLALGLTGTYIAIIRGVPLSMLNGLVLCYFVLSAMNTVWQGANKTNNIDKALFVFVTLITTAFAWYSYKTTQVEGGELGGFAIQAYVFFGSIMALCCVADYRYIKRGGLSGQRKLTRHLWRMFFPLFMSTAAFFLGQAKLLPESLQRIEFLLLPVALVILSAFYWLIKVNKQKQPVLN